MKNNNLKKNIAYNFVYQVLILFLPFVTAPYLSRTIGASGVGTYSFSQSIAMYFTYMTMLGLNNYGNRSIAAVQEDREKRSKLFYEVYFMQLIMAAISISAYVFYIFVLSIDREASILMSFWVLSAALDINWFFFGMEQFKLTVMRNAIIKISSVASIFIFVKSKDDVYVYIGIMAISTFLSQCCLWFYLRKFVDFYFPIWKNIKRHFKPNLKLFIPVIAASIYNMMDKIMLGYMTDMREVGFYENAEKIIKMIQSLIVAVGTVMLPRMTALFAKEDNKNSRKYFDVSMEIVIIYVIAAIFGILAVGENFTAVYFGNGFSRTALLLKILIITVFFFGAGNVLRTQYLIPMKKDKIFIRSSLIGAILNIIVNAALIPIYGAVGASIATIFAEISVCVYQFYKVRDEIDLKKYLPVIMPYTICGVVMYLVVKNIPPVTNSMLNLMIQVGGGALTYIALVMSLFFIKKKIIRKSSM